MKVIVAVLAVAVLVLAALEVARAAAPAAVAASAPDRFSITAANTPTNSFIILLDTRSGDTWSLEPDARGVPAWSAFPHRQ